MTSLVPTKVFTDTFRYSYVAAESGVDVTASCLWVTVRDSDGRIWVTQTAAGIPSWSTPFVITVMDNVVSHCLLMTPAGAVILMLDGKGVMIAVRPSHPHDVVAITPPSGGAAWSLRGMSKRDGSGDTILVAAQGSATAATLVEMHVSFAAWPPALSGNWVSMGSGFQGSPVLVAGNDELWIFAAAKDHLYYKIYRWNGLWGKKWFSFSAPFITQCYAGFVEMASNGDRYIAVSANCNDGTNLSVLTWYEQAPSGGLYAATDPEEAVFIAAVVNQENMLIGCAVESGTATIFTYFVKEGGPWRTSFRSRTFPDAGQKDLAWCPLDISAPYGAGYLLIICSDTSANLGTQISIIGSFDV